MRLGHGGMGGLVGQREDRTLQTVTLKNGHYRTLLFMQLCLDHSYSIAIRIMALVKLIKALKALSHQLMTEITPSNYMSYINS